VTLPDWAKEGFEMARKEQPATGLGQDFPTEKAGSDPGWRKAQGWLDGLLEMEELGKEYWEGVDPDEFVRNLRKSWE
jgi:hypothetical protein